MAAGCEDASKTTKRSTNAAAAQRQASQSAALLKSAIGRLRDLPYAVDVELQPPSVVLDARSSANGQEILATVGYTPGEEMSGLNLLTVLSKNAGFLGNEVRDGDLVKCYLLPDRESRLRLRETGELDRGLINYEAVELRVAQVLSPNSLRVENGLRIPAGIAKELGENLSPQTILELEKLGVPDPANLVDNVMNQLDDRGLITSEGVPLPEAVVGILPGIAWPFKIEVWRIRDDRMREVGVQLGKYASQGKPAFGWEPSADQAELEQLLQRINQWTRGRKQPDDWAPTKLFDNISESFRDNADLAEYLSPDALSRKTFAPYEARLIQEAIWLRDISRWAAGDRFEPVTRAANLFDWVVRNVTLSDDPRVATNRPWQTLLAGRGTAAQRAWVFAGLCRQQQIPAAVIELPIADGDPWLWCAVLSEGELYLFDPQLGLAVPATDGDTPATLASLKESPELLRTLDLPDAAYPIDGDALTKLNLSVVAEPMSLSWRAGEFQTQLRGEDALVLQVDADAQAAEIQELEAGEVSLWAEPFDFFRRRLRFGPNNRNVQGLEFRAYAWRPVLWQARTLHFRGLYETEQQAKQKAERKGDALYEALNDHRVAARRYSDRSVRPSDLRLSAVSLDKRRIYQRAKIDATYWLGLLKFDQGTYTSSRQWLENASLDAPAAEYRADGVRYNLARALEAIGEDEQAAELLASDESPQRHGNRLRALRLLEGQATPAEETAENATEPEPAGDDA